MPEVTIVINGHREGQVLLPSLSSARNSVNFANENGISTEVILVLDRPDPETLDVANAADWIPIQNLLTVDFGDLGLSRNAGVQKATGRFICFLDGDDLFGKNWIHRAYLLANKHGEEHIYHPALNLYFGSENSYILRHLDSQEPSFSKLALADANFWTALSFGKREIYLKFPYRKNQITIGFGYEDWHWNCETLANDHAHCVVPETMHWIRQKAQGSLVQASASADCMLNQTALFSPERFIEIPEIPKSIKIFWLIWQRKIKAVIQAKKSILQKFPFILKLIKKLRISRIPNWLAVEIESHQDYKMPKNLRIVTPEVFGFGDLLAKILSRYKPPIDQIFIVDNSMIRIPNALILDRKSLVEDPIGKYFCNDDSLYLQFLALVLIQSRAKKVYLSKSPTSESFLRRFGKAISMKMEVTLFDPEKSDY